MCKMSACMRAQTQYSSGIPDLSAILEMRHRPAALSAVQARTPGVLCCAVVVNRDGKLEEAVEQIKTIIAAEKRRTSRIRWQDADAAAQAERLPSLQC